MKSISCAAELKLAIQEKELEQQLQGQILRDEVRSLYEELKPISLIKKTLDDISSFPYLKDNLLGAVAGIVTGYIAKKVPVGDSNHTIRNIIGSVLQFGVTNLVAHHPEILKAFGTFIIDKLMGKKNEDNNEIL